MNNSKKLHDEEFQKIDSTLAGLLNLELIHEQRLGEIETVMAHLYSEEWREWCVEQGYLDEEEEDDFPIPSTYELYEFVEVKKQFIEDYKQAFIFCILSSNFSSPDEIVEAIIQSRN